MINNNKTGVAYSQRHGAQAQKPSLSDRDDAITQTPLDTPTPSTEVFTVKVSCNGDMGRVSGNGLSEGALTAHKGDSVTLTATPKTGYAFVKWLGLPMSQKETDPTVTFTVPSNLNITAVFDKKEDEPAGEGVNGDTDLSSTKETGLKALLKKYWWVPAIVAGYWLYKEGKL